MFLFLMQPARDFLKTELIRGYLRSTISESKLSALSILSIKSDFDEALSFEDMILEFCLVILNHLIFK